MEVSSDGAIDVKFVPSVKMVSDRGLRSPTQVSVDRVAAKMAQLQPIIVRRDDEPKKRLQVTPAEGKLWTLG